MGNPPPPRKKKTANKNNNEILTILGLRSTVIQIFFGTKKVGRTSIVARVTMYSIN